MHAFLTIALIHLLAVASPGPDLVIIIKQSISQPYRVVLWTSLGIALGILMHVAYSLLGIGLIISQSIVLFSAIKWIGALYLLFIGWKALTARAPQKVNAESNMPVAAMPRLRALKIGFLCNALNPKVTLFFLALFTQVINPATPMAVQLGYGLYMGLQTFVWFSLVGSVLSLRVLRKYVTAFQLWAERVMGAVLIALGLKIALGTRE